MENAEPVRGAVLATYRYLRLGMVVLIVFLGTAILFARLSATCEQSTISDYYFTTAHTVFIGAICALGACLIVYQGSSHTEDALLNFSGFLAFIVALVPTTRPKLCGRGLPDGYDAAVGDSVKALLVAAALSLVIYLPIKIASIRRRSSAPQAEPATRGWATFFDWVQRLIPWLLAVLLIAGVVFFFSCPPQFERHAHGWSAAALFASIILVVVINAIYAWQRTDRSRVRKFWVTVVYSVIAGLMIVTLIAAIFVYAKYGPEWKQWGVIALESALILWFLAFWAVQTVDLWNVSDYRAVLPARPKVPIR
jgi:hypothetical protein